MGTRSRPKWVVKANSLVNARYDWTMLQQRMILQMIAQLDPREEDFGNQTIYIADLMDLGQVSGNAYYERATEAAKVLLDQKIFFSLDDGRWRGYNLLSYVSPGPGYIEARFNPDMRPFLLQLKRRFTRYMLQHVMQFQSPYSIRIYELAQQFADIGHRTIDLDDLREMLVIEDKYPRFYDFKRRVLEQAKKEINRFTDLTIAYEVLRERRVPKKVRLYIRRKEPGEPRGKVRKTVDPAQRGLPLPAPDQPAAPRAEKPKEAGEGHRSSAFIAWWRQRTDAERVELERRARERFSPFERKLWDQDPEGQAIQASLRQNIFELWQEEVFGASDND